MNRVSKVLFIAAASLAMTGVAYADDPKPDGGGGGDAAAGGAPATGTPDGAAPAPAAPADAGGVVMYTKDNWSTELNARPLTLAKGMIQIHVDALINLSDSKVFKPFAIAPDIFYGVSDKLSVGIVHNLGLCLTGTDNGCGKVYNDIGLDALLQLKRDAKMELAGEAGLDISAIDPGTLDIHVGVQFKYVAGKIGIFVSPALQIGLNNRDPDVMAMTGGNKETIALPIIASYQASNKLAVFLHTGIAGIGLGPNAGAPLDGFGDGFVIPLGVGALFGVSNKLDIGGEFLFPGIAGSDLASTDARVLIITGNIRL